MMLALLRRFADRAVRRENELYRQALHKIGAWEVLQDTGDTRLIKLYASESAKRIPFEATPMPSGEKG